MFSFLEEYFPLILTLFISLAILITLISNKGFWKDAYKILKYRSSVAPPKKVESRDKKENKKDLHEGKEDIPESDPIAAAALSLQVHAQKIIFIFLSLFLISKGIIELLDTFNFFDKNIHHNLFYWQGNRFTYVQTYWVETVNKWSIINHIKHVKTLSYVANALAISCGLQLAYMLVTEGPDEAIEPIMLGIASVILLILSTVDPARWDIYNSISILLLIAGIYFLFMISNKLKTENKKIKIKIVHDILYISQQI